MSSGATSSGNPPVNHSKTIFHLTRRPSVHCKCDKKFVLVRDHNGYARFLDPQKHLRECMGYDHALCLVAKKMLTAYLAKKNTVKIICRCTICKFDTNLGIFGDEDMVCGVKYEPSGPVVHIGFDAANNKDPLLPTECAIVMTPRTKSYYEEHPEKQDGDIHYTDIVDVLDNENVPGTIVLSIHRNEPCDEYTDMPLHDIARELGLLTKRTYAGESTRALDIATGEGYRPPHEVWVPVNRRSVNHETELSDDEAWDILLARECCVRCDKFLRSSNTYVYCHDCFKFVCNKDNAIDGAGWVGVSNTVVEELRTALDWLYKWPISNKGDSCTICGASGLKPVFYNGNYRRCCFKCYETRFYDLKIDAIIADV